MQDIDQQEMNDPGVRSIQLHGPEGYAGMRKAGRLAAEVLDYITPYVEPGISTGELDRLCHAFTEDHGAISAPLNYRGFPKSICTSVNHVVCHGIPDDAKKLAPAISSTSTLPSFSMVGMAIPAVCLGSARCRARPSG